AMVLAPGGQCCLRQEDTDGISQLAVGGDVKDELCGGSFGIIGQGCALAYEVILVDVALRAGISLQSADRHADIMDFGGVRVAGPERAFTTKLRIRAARLPPRQIPQRRILCEAHVHFTREICSYAE